jgi:leucyl/phenylalanyl-tRNA---protein transferase
MPPLPWLEPGMPFPDPREAWGPHTEAPGLLAAGADLSPSTLQAAYSQAVFPWFSEGQPILWWSTDPRMVLQTRDFRLHASLRKTLKAFVRTPRCEVRMDTAFGEVIHACAQSARRGQFGTWIVDEMIDAYCALHAQGLAHSVETWADGKLVGGLYCVALGQAVFGESMFMRQTDASKIALAGLVAFCLHHGIAMIDCQQNTPHLASMGAREMPRAAFARHVEEARHALAPTWQFSPLYWSELLPA